MNMDKLTQKSHEALQEAHSAALRHGHSEADVDGARVTVDVEGGQLVIRPEIQGHTEERTETAA